MREINENGVNLERTREYQEPLSKYYIVSEGDKTEIQYFEGIKENREKLNIKPLIDIRILENEENEQGESHPLKKIENFSKSIENEKINYSSDIDKVFFVIDRDPQNFKEKQLDTVINVCKTNGYNICLSNPTFEIFLLMHDDRIFSLDRKEII